MRSEDGMLAGLVDIPSLCAVTVPDDAIEPPPAIYRGLAREYLQGVARHDARMFVVLDASRLLTSTERIEMERTMRAPQA